MILEECLKSSEEALILENLVVGGEGTKRKDGSLLKVSFFCDG